MAGPSPSPGMAPSPGPTGGGTSMIGTTFSGKVTAISANKNTFQVRLDNGRNVTVVLTSRTRLADQMGRTMTLAELKVGETVKIQGSMTGNQIQATMIAIASPSPDSSPGPKPQLRMSAAGLPRSPVDTGLSRSLRSRPRHSEWDSYQSRRARDTQGRYAPRDTGTCVCIERPANSCRWDRV